MTNPASCVTAWHDAGSKMYSKCSNQQVIDMPCIVRDMHTSCLHEPAAVPPSMTQQCEATAGIILAVT